MKYFYLFALILVGCSTRSHQPTMSMSMESEQETLPPIMSGEMSRSQGNSPLRSPSPQSAQPESPGTGSQLPPCPGAYNANWMNCVGTVKLSSGVEYVGEWRDGQATGQGTFMWPDDRKYVGEFRDSRRNGYGAQTYPSGAKYLGEWRDGEPNGQGIQYGADGDVLRSGVWENGIFIKGQ
jgi:hypothetical protein